MKIKFMEKVNILLGYSLFHPTKLILMKYHGKLCDKGSSPEAKYLANLLPLEEYGISASRFFLQKISSSSC